MIKFHKDASIHICDEHENLYQGDGYTYQPHNVGYIDNETGEEGEFQLDLYASEPNETKLTTITEIMEDLLEENCIKGATIMYIEPGDEDLGKKIK